MSERIPVRMWPDRHTALFGYLTVSDSVTEGDNVSYSVNFVAEPLMGVEPRCDVRLEEK